jgi:hypothetical protein
MAGLDPAIITSAAASEDATVNPWHDEATEVSPLLVMAGLDPAIITSAVAEEDAMVKPWHGESLGAGLPSSPPDLMR